MNRDSETQQDRLARLAADRSEPDTSDIPEAPAGAWTNAEVGKFFRPRKEAVTIRLDADVLQWFREETGGRGYQTAINAALRDFVAKGGR